MRKVLLQAPPENGAITNYTSEVSRLLRPDLPGERADEIVGEAEAHLYDQAETIKVRENVSQNEAEARAVAAFTPAIHFAREMARSAVETRFSKAWFGVSKVVAAVALGVLAAGFFVDGLVTVPYTIGSAVSFSQPVFGILLLALCLCAFLARRAQTVRLLSVTALAGAFVFVYSGFLYVIPPQIDAAHETATSRVNAWDSCKGWRDARSQAERDEKRLVAGLQTYRAGNPVVPADLKTANGKAYLVLTPINQHMHLAHTRQSSAYYYPLDPSHRASVKTLAQARAHWLADGPVYLAQARYEQKYALGYEEPLRIAAQQTGFSKSAGWDCAQNIIFPALFLMLFDWLFAKMGCALYAKRRARRERKLAQAR